VATLGKSAKAKKVGQPATLEELKGRVAYLEDHGLLTFGVPRDGSEEQHQLAHRIALLDKRAHRELGFGTPAWEAVILLLVNAISIGVENGRVSEGKELLNEATQTFQFYRSLPTRNRLYYLAGLLVGIAALTVLAAVFGTAFEPELEPRQLLLATLFAGLGCLASVLSRLSQIDELREEHSRVNLIISGAGRPVIAAILAVVVSILLDLKVVTFHVGEQANADARLYLVAAFLCGFSERFAEEVLGRFLPQDESQPPVATKD
jgi:hypothetical protein